MSEWRPARRYLCVATLAPLLACGEAFSAGGGTAAGLVSDPGAAWPADPVAFAALNLL